MHCAWYAFAICLFLGSAYAQPAGKLLLVGGGAEEPGGWSDAPYTWATQQGPNARVAILGLDTANAWYEAYFASLGATHAQGFAIPNPAAAALLYDTLRTFGCVFIRGGDQWAYYQAWAGTPVEAALRDNFGAGGVVGGTSAGMALLSGVWFSAENGTVYPDENLQDPHNPYNTLRTDFLALLPGYLFDTHFVQRGRLARLVGMLARWHHDTGQTVTGIGVDDKTALCLHPALGYGLPHGTAAVAWLRPSLGLGQPYPPHPTGALSATTIAYSQALDGDTLWLATGEVSHLPLRVVNHPEHNLAYEPQHTVIVANDDSPTANAAALQRLVQRAQGGNIAILTGADSALALQYRAALQPLVGTGFIPILSVHHHAALAPTLHTYGGLLIAGLSWAEWAQYCQQNPLQLWSAHLNGSYFTPDAVYGGNYLLAGESAELVNPLRIGNLATLNAAYQGLLSEEYAPQIMVQAFGLLVHRDVYVPSTALYENHLAGLPWGLARGLPGDHSLGLWLSPGGAVEFAIAHSQPDNSAGCFSLRGVSSLPTVVFSPTLPFDTVWARTDTATQPYALGQTRPRAVAGFSRAGLAVLAPGDTLAYGQWYAEGRAEAALHGLSLFPNPSAGAFTVVLQQYARQAHLSVHTMAGQRVHSEHLGAGQRFSPHLHLPPGVYAVTVRANGTPYTARLVVAPR
jgi:cyanophycinase-like exopeptidase